MLRQARFARRPERTDMTLRTGKDATIWERGFAPAGFLVLLFTLFFSQFSLPETVAPDHARMASEGGVAPSPLSGSADDLWLPASHAERRAAKAKSGLPDAGDGGKAVLPGSGALLYPFETASTGIFGFGRQTAPAHSAPGSFRSRAPPAIAA